MSEEGAGNDNTTTEPTSWSHALPEDIRANPNITKFSNLESLAKGYINASQMIGRDKIVIPQSDEEWSDAYSKLGRPETAGDYTLGIPEDAPEDVLKPDEYTNSFKELAFGLGLNSNQMEGLSKFLYEHDLDDFNTKSIVSEQSSTDLEKSLRSEWGPAFEQKMAAVNAVSKAFVDDDTADYLDESGIGNDIHLIKMFSEIGAKMLGDSNLVGDPEPTTADIQEQISKLMGSDAYINKRNAEHSIVVKKVERLFEEKNQYV